MPGGRRDIAAAQRFFSRAVRRHGAPEGITPDGYRATHAAIAELKKGGVLRPQTKVRAGKYLNDIVGRDRGRVKQLLYPVLGLKRFRSATIAITGVGLAQGIRKRQFDTSAVIVRAGARVPRVRGAVPSARGR